MHIKSVDPDELAAYGHALYGERWQTSLAEDMGVADRTMRRWLSGQSPIPVGTDGELRRILEERLRLIGGLVGYVVNWADHSVFHHPTCAYFRIEDGDALNLLFDKLIPPDQRELVIAGAQEALRRERERDPRIVGKFVWGKP